ncbi:MAG: DUF4920 domain-containing protein [Flavobacteriaceae bacterium]|nr:DUF4920 domain-containing protein [Flavobacteriaceae bacterium]|tara:strand:- start:3344 stop:3799 length:456 start_codon:yes stop_codon:yes gene_type:complete
MKKLLILLLFIPLVSFGQDETILNFYGEKIDLEEIENYKKDKNFLLSNSEKNIKIQGKILSTCPMKGCWMKIGVENDTVLVRFKDYGFFVPKTGSQGKSTVINGKLSIDTISIKQLKHYAEDAGKSKEEIALINRPEITLSFLADGVIIKD